MTTGHRTSVIRFDEPWGTLVRMATPRTALGAVLVSALLLAAPAAGVAAAPAAGEQSLSAGQPSLRADWQQRMLERLNAVRATAGSPPVRLCPALGRSAEAYAREMARDNRFSHTGSDGSTTQERIAASGYRPVLVGETLAAGQPTVAEAMGDWRRSSTHYAAMTDPRFRHVGFGFEPGRSPQRPTFWVQHFGAGGRC